MSLRQGTPRLQRKVNYVNDGDAPVTLDLDLGVDSDLFTVDSPTVTVPAHGSAAATVTARVPAERAGEFSGALVATAGDVTLTTPLTANLPGPKHTLTVKVLSRDEHPDGALLIVQDERTGLAQGAFVIGDTATFTVPSRELPRARPRPRTSPAGPTRCSSLPTGRVDKDTEFVVDTKRGKEITTSVDDPDARAQGGGRHRGSCPRRAATP